MFPARYFCRRMFAARYFPKVGQSPTFQALWAAFANRTVGLLIEPE